MSRSVFLSISHFERYTNHLHSVAPSGTFMHIDTTKIAIERSNLQSEIVPTPSQHLTLSIGLKTAFNFDSKYSIVPGGGGLSLEWNLDGWNHAKSQPRCVRSFS